MAWFYLALGGLFEVGFTTCMRYIDTFRLDLWNLAFIVCVIASFGFLQEAQKTIPLGTANAVWVGIGVAGTVLVGVALGEEVLSMARLLLLGDLVACAIGLKLVH